MDKKTKVCFVIQRYGTEIVGGAESLCMQYAQRMKELYDVSVVTSCAVDYNTWDNYYAEGETTVGGVPVVRFASAHPRRQGKIARLTEAVYGNPKNSDRLGKKWLKEVGPYCPGMLRYIKQNRRDIDLFVFVGYHYYNSTFGMPCAPEKAVFLPTAHDEPPLRKCNYFKRLFVLPQGLIYLTEEEREFVQGFFGNARIPSIVTGAGVDDIHLPGHSVELVQKYTGGDPYLLYAGRIDETKNCDALVRDFVAYKERHPGGLKLLLTGKNEMELPARADISYAGFVADEEKYALMKHAAALVQPSQNESLSIVTLEAMKLKTPVICCGRSAVLKSHIEKSNGGLCYASRDELEQAIQKVTGDRAWAQEAGARGEEYVRQNYKWEAIIASIGQLIGRIIEKRKTDL
ncbi:MAG TPA: hexosyltransferase [Clostridiales bacterium]|nr:hexosyltransferase [Clostridiales bacterium]